MTFAFAGTPEFGALVLEELVRMGRVPALVVSQPARPAGRGRAERSSSVATFASAGGLPLLETADINEEAAVAALEGSRASVLLVAAFGQMLRGDVLSALECINVHASLLPAYRGAAPVVRALMEGETETGVCIMKMTEGLDEGPVAARASVSVGSWDDRASLERLLALSGAHASAHVMDALAGGYVEWEPQGPGATYAAKLSASERGLDLSQPARRVHDHVRAFSPTPGASVSVAGMNLKVLRSWPSADARSDSESVVDDRPGAVAVVGERLFVGCGEGRLEVLALQPEGRKVMTAAEFLRGYGARLSRSADTRT